jgi:alkylhydroperoxidase/carboxymuconolactone decarboxylase family protein YurZ
MSNQPPKHFTRFSKNYPYVAKAYSELGEAVHDSRPIDEKTRALIRSPFPVAQGHKAPFMLMCAKPECLIFHMKR